jgi:hypothetical protein
MEAIADMICLGFFFLCRPGEHTLTKDNTPFTLNDVTLYRSNHTYTYLSCDPVECDNGTAVTMTFTTQKNGVKNETIRNGFTGHPLVCPVRALARRLTYHHIHNSPPDTPLCAFYTREGRRRHVTSRHITLALRNTLKLLHTEGQCLNIKPEEIDARSLRSGGATAMLCAEIDKDLTQLQGRWKSDAMIRCLHMAAAPIVDKFAQKMLAAGDFSFFPGLETDCDGCAFTYEEPDPDDLPVTSPPGSPPSSAAASATADSPRGSPPSSTAASAAANSPSSRASPDSDPSDPTQDPDSTFYPSDHDDEDY